jgi:hypothetical protein
VAERVGEAFEAGVMGEAMGLFLADELISSGEGAGADGLATTDITGEVLTVLEELGFANPLLPLEGAVAVFVAAGADPGALLCNAFDAALGVTVLL